MIAIGTYSVTKWEENTCNQISSEMKMTKATVEYTITGDINCQAGVEYLMFYKYVDSKDPHQSSAIYIGLIRLVGKVHGQEGSFVVEDHGVFDHGIAHSELQIIPGSGTGEFKSIHGAGRYRADQKGATFELDYQLDSK